jgi:hypothetical protein
VRLEKEMWQRCARSPRGKSDHSRRLFLITIRKNPRTSLTASIRVFCCDPVCPRRADPALNEQIEDDIIRLAPASSLERVARLLGAEPDAADKIDEREYQAGVDDISIILTDYNGCSGKAFAQAYTTLKTFVRGRP